MGALTVLVVFSMPQKFYKIKKNVAKVLPSLMTDTEFFIEEQGIQSHMAMDMVKLQPQRDHSFTKREK